MPDRPLEPRGPQSHPDPSEPTRSARSNRVRRGRSAVEKLIISCGVIATVVALSAAGVLAWSLDKWNQIDVAPIDGLAGSVDGEAENWLLVGSDSRAGIDDDDPNAGVILGEGKPDGKRTDTIIVARIDPARTQVHLLSIPRDLLVNYSDGGDGRINAAFNGEGGEQRLLETIEQNFDIEINHYAEINLAGFQDVVDAIGGVPIWFDRAMRDAGSGLAIDTAGCHELNGSQALAFARGRSLEYFEDGSWRIDGTGDLGRTSRQQYFLKRVAATAMSRLDITDLGTVNAVLNAGGENFTRDATTGPEDLLALASSLASLADDQIISHSLPVFDFRTATGAAVLGLDQEVAEPIFAVFRGEEVPVAAVVGAPPATYAVYNGSGIGGLAKATAQELNGHGLDVPLIFTNPAPADRTVIRYAPGQEVAAERLAAYLVAGPAYEVDASLSEVVLIVGADWQGIRATPRDNVQISGATPADSGVGDGAETTAATAPPVTQPTVGIVPGPTPAGTSCE
jgi:polyisoprenyl-teichoic acid--peptidoglycan teichoic acid transferase